MPVRDALGDAAHRVRRGERALAGLRRWMVIGLDVQCTRLGQSGARVLSPDWGDDGRRGVLLLRSAR